MILNWENKDEMILLKLFKMKTNSRCFSVKFPIDFSGKRQHTQLKSLLKPEILQQHRMIESNQNHKKKSWKNEEWAGGINWHHRHEDFCVLYAFENWKNWKINMFYQYLHAFHHVVKTILHFTLFYLLRLHSLCSLCVVFCVQSSISVLRRDHFTFLFRCNKCAIYERTQDKFNGFFSFKTHTFCVLFCTFTAFSALFCCFEK